MNWTKIPTNLLISRTPDNELVAIVKYQLLWADLEYQPTDEIALRYMSNKQLASVKQYLNDIEAQVVSDIESTVNHRGSQKTYYKKKQSLKQNTDGQCDNQYDSQCENHTDGADKIRLDKIRKEKEISNDISKKKPIDFDTPFQAGGQMWVFPFEFRALAQKYWTDEAIREIEKSFSCQEKDTEISIKMLLEQYPSDQIDIDAEFEKFWNAYTPVKTTDGRAVNKGSRKETFTKYSRIIKSGVKPADILKGLNAYLTDCRNNNRFTCGATVFLNQERWKDDYNTTTIIAQQPQPTMPHMSLKDMKEMQKMAEIQKILNGEQ